MTLRTPILVTLLVLLAAPTSAQIVLDDFENGVNQGGWSSSSTAFVDPAGGNPGAWMRSDATTFAGLVSVPGTPFSGSWRALGVSSIRVDIRITSVSAGPHFEPVVLVLSGDGGTPGFPNDDCTLWLTGPVGPQTTDGWTTFDFAIDTTATTMPANGLNVPLMNVTCNTPDNAWNSVIENVSRVAFQLGNPQAPSGLTWDIGFDNVRLATSFGEAFCFGDGAQTPCPCGNFSALGASAGCANSSGAGARLEVSGSPSVAADSLGFALAGAVPGGFALLVSGDTRLPASNPGVGVPAFDGLRCVGGGVLRHGSRAVDAVGAASWGTQGGFVSAQGFAAGTTRYFQAFYRDNPLLVCQTGRNQSSARIIVFAP